MLSVLCPAKLNLFLAIGPRDSSGYHLLDTVFMRTRLFQDTLTFEYADEPSFRCATLPEGENSVVNALHTLEAATDRQFNYRITLEKKIPIGSGLGGASSDAAALLETLNMLEGLGLSRQQLMDLGAQVGMDVPFFLSGFAMARGTHFGEVLTPLSTLPPTILVQIQVGAQPASTKSMFERWDAEGHSSAKNADELIHALEAGDNEMVLKNLHNDFQIFYPNLPTNAILTGSGSAAAVYSLGSPKVQS